MPKKESLEVKSYSPKNKAPKNKALKNKAPKNEAPKNKAAFLDNFRKIVVPFRKYFVPLSSIINSDPHL